MRQGFSLGKVIRIAGREFASTALTKGFIIGALVVPAVIMAIIPLVLRLAATATPPVTQGTVVIVDRTGQLGDLLSARLSEESLRPIFENRERRRNEIASAMSPIDVGNTDTSDFLNIEIPEFRVEILPRDTDIDAQKARIREQTQGETDEDPLDRILSVIEIDADAVERAEGTDEFGAWQPFFRPKINSEAVSELELAVEWAIKERRYEIAGMDRGEIALLNRVQQRKAQEITEEGERNDTSDLTSMIIPVVAMMLILVSTFTGGQYLLTTTIEEKSSRVVEVLLSAVSPMELMTGKILGQMWVGLSLMLIYNGIGIVALVAFGITGLVSVWLIMAFFVFYILAYTMFASLMAAIGAAVNDMREAQALMTPVIIFSMVPYFFFLPVVRAPNSLLSTVMSFIPPISPFIMIMRIASPETIPAWQIALSIVVNLLGVVLFLWFAAKVFRVGLLMFGKPPNLRTLIKWVRMA